MRNKTIVTRDNFKFSVCVMVGDATVWNVSISESSESEASDGSASHEGYRSVLIGKSSALNRGVRGRLHDSLSRRRSSLVDEWEARDAVES